MARLTLPVLLLLPALIIIVGLVGYPLTKTVWLSFTDTRLGDLIGGSGEWVGLENYKEVFTDEHLRTSLINTVVFGTACVVGTMVLGFAVAVLLNQRLRGNLLFSIAVLLPWAVPALAASAIWRWLFDDRYGYRESFALGHYGVGAAVAVVLFLVLLGFSIVYVRMIGREGRA